ncbi:MAG TPA: glycoside hydrolase family 13 protein [Fodinibius sp.]|nr:glycoside hydrolase family 13 protein [Fodinibius sp.]
MNKTTSIEDNNNPQVLTIPAQGEQQLVPGWAKGVVWYQIFPERFRNGDPSNDPTGDRIDAPEGWQCSSWTADWYERTDWERTMGNDFNDGVYLRRYGGDLQGIIDKLDYLQELGVEALYLNPVFDAVSLHKYDTSYYHHIDRFFGPDPKGDQAIMEAENPEDPDSWQWTAADRLFLKLVEEVHNREMRIIIDGVFNHSGTDFWAFRDLKEKQEQSAYRNWYEVNSFRKADDPNSAFEYDSWWDFKTLPEFKHINNNLVEPVKEHIFAITRRWLAPDGNPDRGVDGWRLDVPEEIGQSFWREWNSLVKSIKPEAYTTGEVWSDNFSDWVGKGLFTATMNYQFAETVQNYMIDQSISASNFLETLKQQAASLPEGAPIGMQNLMDSHDTPRLASMVVNPGRPYNKDGKPKYGFNVRKPDSSERRLQKFIALFQFSYPGAPMIYYGTEAGMWGAGDPDDRKPMVWPDFDYEPEKYDPLGRERPTDDNNFDTALFNWYKKLIWMRQKHPSLRKGKFKAVQYDNHKNTFTFARTLDNAQPILAVFNRSELTQQILIPMEGLDWPPNTELINTLTGAEVSISAGFAKLYLPPVTGAILISDDGDEVRS